MSRLKKLKKIIFKRPKLFCLLKRTQGYVGLIPSKTPLRHLIQQNKNEQNNNNESHIQNQTPVKEI